MRARDTLGVMTLLGSRDPHPVRVSNPDGLAPFLVVADHAGRRRPATLGALGVAASDWDRHVAYDIGVEEVGGLLARRLDAVLVEQRYSRLVIDCNRTPGHPGSVPERSENVAVPANRELAGEERRRREAEILEPYHRAIDHLLDRRRAEGRPTIFVSLHSFTPIYDGRARRWIAGVLHDGRSPFATATLAGLRGRFGDLVGDNEPYRLDGTSDYTVPLHAWTRGLDHVEIEVRQDLVADENGQAEWAAILADALLDAAGRAGAR